MNTQKGASEVIVVTLIIVVTVILAGIFFAWLKNSSKERMDQATDELKQASDLSCMDAKFIVDSCNIYSSSGNKVSLVFRNDSNLRVFNLVLTIQGKNGSEEDLVVAGRFEKVVSKGEMTNLSTDANFTYTIGDENLLTTLNPNSIYHMILTNGTCPKESIILNNCTVN